MSPPALPVSTCVGCAEIRKPVLPRPGTGYSNRGDTLMTLRATCFSAVTAALLMATASTGAKANVEVGGLSCRSLGGVSYIVGATMSFQCVFVPSYGGPVHRYVGVIRRVGVDLGWT